LARPQALEFKRILALTLDQIFHILMLQQVQI